MRENHASEHPSLEFDCWGRQCHNETVCPVHRYWLVPFTLIQQTDSRLIEGANGLPESQVL